ncbi:MAG: carboxypeptidase-like regulatory domain-containing protein [Candidatus Margulisbacteria bacterium]|nr:carboxypeptidase-like regulatory domain-containing protein [Candidatus Margulisiibacteriota bacterium]
MPRIYRVAFLTGVAVILAGLLAGHLSGCGDLEGGVASSITVSPSSTTIGVSSSKAFTAIGKDSNGKIVATTVTWSVTGGIGGITSSGFFTAGAVEGAGIVTATAGTISGQASVTITEKGWIAGKVNTSDSSIPVGLKVYLPALSTAVDFTDSSGYYELEGVPAGTYTVQTLETALYQVASDEVTLGKGETAQVNLFATVKPNVPTTTTTTIPTF